MIESIFVGMIAGSLVTIADWLPYGLPSFQEWSPAYLFAAVLLAVGVRFLVASLGGLRRFEGIAGLFVHVHLPSRPDGPLRWGVQALTSLLVAAAGGGAGVEGAACEGTHAYSQLIRSRAARWFEQRRRTDSATALAASISAAFAAPLSGILFPIELSLGGRNLAVATASFAAFVTVKGLLGGPALGDLSPSSLGLAGELPWVDLALSTVVLATVMGLVGVGLVVAVRSGSRSLDQLFGKKVWARILVAGGLLATVLWAVPDLAQGPAPLLSGVLSRGRGLGEMGVLVTGIGFQLVLLACGLGTIGLFWPGFALGGLAGGALAVVIAPSVTPVVAFAGGAAFLAAVFGTPLSAAALAYELSGSPVVLVCALAAGWGAREFRRTIFKKSLLDLELEALGVPLVEGRSASVLDAVLVWEAMITDHETVAEKEPVADLHGKALKSRYPFLPVIGKNGQYLGMLTGDMIQEYLAKSKVSSLLEAKDLLYRAGAKGNVLRLNDRLSASNGMFEESPCVAVLNDDDRLVGLLFVHHVRLAYDREMARRSLIVRGGAVVGNP